MEMWKDTSKMEGGYYRTNLCDRLRLLTGAVLMDEQQGGYRVRRPNLGTEASFRFGWEAVRTVPCPLGSSPSL